RSVGGRQEALGDQHPDEAGRQQRHLADDQADGGRHGNDRPARHEADARQAAAAVGAQQHGPNHSREDQAMLHKITLLALTAGLVALLAPSRAGAYGAAHVGYTHVGPNGVYHTGETVARGPGGTYEAGRTSAYGAGGGAYHAGYGGAAVGGA